jgi:hypothetical protein
MSFWSRLFVRRTGSGGRVRASAPPAPSGSRGLGADVVELASRLIDRVNQALRESVDSSDPPIKVARLEVARSKLDELRRIGGQHRYIAIETLAELELRIARLHAQYCEAGYHEAEQAVAQPPAGRPADGPGTTPPGAADDNGPGFRFCATLRLRTPARVLVQHGAFLPVSAAGALPRIAEDRSDGNWRRCVPAARRSSRLRPVPEVGQRAVDDHRLLRFLLAVRKIVEGREPVAQRRDRLVAELAEPAWSGLVERLGGPQSIVESFFRPYVTTIPGLADAARSALIERGLSTPAAIAAASDAYLLAVKGLGPAKLAALRAACAAADDPQAELVESFRR